MRMSLPGIHDVVQLWVLCLLRSLPNLVVLLEVAAVEVLQGKYGKLYSGSLLLHQTRVSSHKNL